MNNLMTGGIKGKAILQPMELDGVELKDGIAKKQFEECLAYFLNLPDDDILYGFRKRAGKQTSGEELGGWYSNDGSFNVYDWDEIFNTFGQWLSFFAKAYKVTERKEIKKKLQYLIQEWGATIEDDGYFFYSWNNNAHHYSYEKIMTGLVDAYFYVDIQEALLFLEIITNWAEQNLKTYKNAADSARSTFTGGEPLIRCIDNEWYTLPENLFRAYLITKQERYAKFADKWLYEKYWLSLRENQIDYLTGVHGYSHVNTLCSAAMKYVVSGQKEYLSTIIQAYDIIEKYQMLASGGFAFDEHMADAKESNYKAIETIAKSYEVACSSYAVMKLTKYLLIFTGEARYADWVERVIYNGLYGMLPMSDDSKRRGKTFYYADYRIGGGRKVYYEHSFPCCSGTFPQALTEYHNIIYYENESTLYISQYLPSVLHTESAEVEIITQYPEKEKIIIKVSGKMNRSIACRIPNWIEKREMGVVINGRKKVLQICPGKWLYLNVKWTGVDIIEVVFPFRLYTRAIVENHPERAALMYGPVMLAACGRYWEVDIDYKHPEEYIKKVGEKLKFETNDGKIRFMPFYEFKEKEWYTVYLDFLKKQ